VGKESARPPFGIELGAGAALVVSASFAAALFPTVDARLVVMAVAVGGCASRLDARAGFAVGGLAYLVFDGFLLNGLGELTWDGTTGLWHLAVFTLAVVVGLGQQWVRTAQADRALSKEIDEMKESLRG
jgi:hypothetical protein